MRSDAFKRDVSVSDELPTAAFTIQGNAKMFSILADKLYSDKPRAVIREIACNALDAHGMNGQTRPIQIALPNHIEPMLTIRDYGPGMSDDDVMLMYTSFGASTKDQGDEAIGGFGLGCKSPFAYADAFTVASVQGGIKRNYAAYRGGDGIPQMSRIDEEVTDEPDGIQVQVPIKTNDWVVFERTAADLLQHFPLGSYEAHGVDVPVIEYTDQKPGYWVRTSAPSNPYVLMGPVAYPLDWNIVLQEGDAKLPGTIVMVFGIGELDLLPSREGLSYDTLTLTRLRDRYRQICDDYAEQQFELVKTMNPFEQLEFIKKLKENSTWSMITKKWPEVRGEAPKGSVIKPIVQEAGFPGIRDEIALPYGRPQVLTVEPKSWRSEKTEVSVSRYVKDAFPVEAFGSDRFFVFDDMKDVSDSKRRITSRARQLAEDMGVTKLAIYLYDHRLDHKGVDEPNWPSIEAMRAHLADWRFADTNIMLLSELPLPEPKTKLASGKKTELRVLTLSPGTTYGGYRYHGQRSDWNQTDELATAGVYIPLSGHDIDEAAKFDSKIINCSWRTEGGQLVLGLSKKAQAQVKRDGNQADFIRLDHWLKAKFDETIRNPDVLAELARQAAAAQVDQDKLTKTVRRLTARHPDLFPTITARLEALKAPGGASALQREIDHARDYARRAGIEMPTPKKLRVSVAKEVEKVYNRSPLLRLAVAVWERTETNIFNYSDEDASALAAFRRTKLND